MKYEYKFIHQDLVSDTEIKKLGVYGWKIVLFNSKKNVYVFERIITTNEED